MKVITVGFIYELIELFNSIGQQEMDIEQAVVVAEAIDGITKHLQELEVERHELVKSVFESDEKREEVFSAFAKQTREIPDVNFKNFTGLKLRPNDILVLKSAGLFADSLDS